MGGGRVVEFVVKSEGVPRRDPPQFDGLAAGLVGAAGRLAGVGSADLARGLNASAFFSSPAWTDPSYDAPAAQYC